MIVKHILDLDEAIQIDSGDNKALDRMLWYEKYAKNLFVKNMARIACKEYKNNNFDRFMIFYESAIRETQKKEK